MEEVKEEYNYMQEVYKLLTMIADQAEKQQLDLLICIKSQKDFIHEISSRVRTTELFKSGEEKYLEYKNRFITIPDRDEAILDAWFQFLHKINAAFSGAFVKGTVIFNLPVIDDLLNE